MTQPLTRDLSATIAALEIVEAELGFQATRLSSRAGTTEQEAEHLSDLRQGYEKSQRYVGILLRYHQGRMGNTQGRPATGGETVDQSGRGRAFIGDEP